MEGMHNLETVSMLIHLKKIRYYLRLVIFIGTQDNIKCKVIAISTRSQSPSKMKELSFISIIAKKLLEI